MAKEKLFVVKIGGNVIDDESQLQSFLHDFTKIREPKVLIHGGGKIATQIGSKLGIAPNYHDGRRITDDETIDLVTMVYGGLINKRIVSSINSLGATAIGLTGADANLIQAHKRPIQDNIDYGWVGDIEKVNGDVLLKLITSDLIPVIAPLTQSKEGQLLNTNADTIAAEIASTLTPTFEVRLIYCFEMDGVLQDIEDPTSLISHLNVEDFSRMKAEGSIHSGMLPKLANAFAALENGANEVIIGRSNKIQMLCDDKFTGCTRMSLV